MTLGDRRVLRRLMEEGNADVGVLRAMLRSGDRHVWQYAAERLGDLGPRAADAVPDLVWFIKDNRGWKREPRCHDAVIAAMKSMARIAPGGAEVIATFREIAAAGEACRRYRSMGNMFVHVRWVAWVQLELMGETEGINSPLIHPTPGPVRTARKWWRFWR